jgi:hypothetical protein
VTDLEARLDDLRFRGIEPVHVVLDGPWKEAFIHPRLAHGVLIQLLELPAPRVRSSTSGLEPE